MFSKSKAGEESGELRVCDPHWFLSVSLSTPVLRRNRENEGDSKLNI